MTPGTRIGPYEILRPLGAGTMGEVFEARDHRLNRSVALKVVSASVSWNEEFICRFEKEGRLLAQVNHPNILSLFDVVNHEGRLLLVTEFLEGAPLRSRLRGAPMPPREALQIGQQVAMGLAAAHDKGLIHRDLKPENIFLTTDGRAKLLDFGLAKLLNPEAGPQPLPPEGHEATVSSGTGPTMVGTPAYMSPEQASGDPLDVRSDIFSFGIVLWEMLAGFRPFPGDGLDVLYSIARQDAPELPETVRVSWGVRQVLMRCLSRNPAQRLRSAHDLAYALETPPSMGGGPSVQEPAKGTVDRRRFLGVAGAGLGVLGLGGLAGWRFARRNMAGQPTFTRLTFGHGTIGQARFVPGERTLVYSAAWQGQPYSVFGLHDGAAESRDLGFADTLLMAVSSKREVILCQSAYQVSGDLLGRSSLVAMGGGAPRPLAESTIAADFSADGERLGLLVQEKMSRFRLEFPVGTHAYTSTQVLRGLRVGGRRLAFVEREGRASSQGWIKCIGEDGRVSTLTKVRGFTGLAWSPDQREVWYSEWWAGESQLWAVDLKGQRRLLLRHGGRIDLQDVDARGRVLASLIHIQQGAYYQGPDDRQAVNLGWFDGNTVMGISAGSMRVLLTKTQDRLSIDGPLYLRPTDGSPALRLGQGYMVAALSGDGAWAATIKKGQPLAIELIPTGVGSPKRIPLPGMKQVGGLQFFPDGKRMMLLGDTTDVDSAIFTLEIESGELRELSHQRRTFFHGQESVSPDGRWMAYNTAELRNEPPYLRGVVTAPVAGGPEREVKGLLRGEAIIGWSPDSASLLVYNRNVRPTPIHRLDPSTGARQPFKVIDLPEPAGVWGLQSVKMSPDARHCAFNVLRQLSNLFLIEGLK